MSAMTDYLEVALLNSTLRNVAFVPPASVYCALFVSPTTDGGGGTEVVGGAYARQVITFSVPVSGAGTTNNTVDLVFPQALAVWGTITHVAVFDLLAGGNMLVHGPAAVPKVIGIGDQYRILATQLVVSFA